MCWHTCTYTQNIITKAAGHLCLRLDLHGCFLGQPTLAWNGLDKKTWLGICTGTHKARLATDAALCCKARAAAMLIPHLLCCMLCAASWHPSGRKPSCTYQSLQSCGWPRRQQKQPAEAGCCIKLHTWRPHIAHGAGDRHSARVTRGCHADLTACLISGCPCCQVLSPCGGPLSAAGGPT